MPRNIVLLTILATLPIQAFCRSPSDQIFHLKRLICPACPSAEIFFNVVNRSAALEQVLSELVGSCTFAVNLITDPALFREVSMQRWAFAVLLMDHLPAGYGEFMRYDTQIRTVAVVRDEFVEELMGALVELDVYNVIYVVYGRRDLLGYFDRFRREAVWYDSVDGDLFRESAKDMMGLKFAVLDVDPVDLFLFENIAKRCNASLMEETRYGSDVHVKIFHDMYYVLGHDPEMIRHVLYMHRFHYYKLIVPQSEQKLLLSVLSDPFDRYVWIANFSSVFVLALFVKTIRDGRFRLASICDLFVKLLGVGLMGSLIQLRTEPERFSVGLYMLISIVLVSAYQSLVISFLLSPRYYPELDNLQQVNATCTWVEDDDNFLLRDAGFLHYGECNDQFPEDVEFEDQILSLFRQKCCMEVSDAYYKAYIEAMNSSFRLSKLTTRQMPVFAALISNSPLHNTVKWFATAFHEAHLYYFIQNYRYQDPTKHRNLEAAPVRVQDLSLVWILYSLGTILCIICITLEIIVHFFKNLHKIKHSQHF